MAFGPHVLEDASDLALAIDGEGGARDPLNLFPVHIFFFDHAKGVGHLLVGIGEQGVGQVVLLLELELRGGRIGRDAQNRQSGLL
jgi:hypothetical protein